MTGKPSLYIHQIPGKTSFTASRFIKDMRKAIDAGTDVRVISQHMTMALCAQLDVNAMPARPALVMTVNGSGDLGISLLMGEMPMVTLQGDEAQMYCYSRKSGTDWSAQADALNLLPTVEGCITVANMTLAASGSIVEPAPEANSCCSEKSCSCADNTF